MKKDEYRIETDSVALGLTRPPIFLGVNIRLFFGLVVVCLLVCVDFQTIYGIPLFVLLYLISARLSVKEPNFFLYWAKAFTKTPPVLNSYFWGGVNSYEAW